jgi:hypothetical protein
MDYKLALENFRDAHKNLANSMVDLAERMQELLQSIHKKSHNKTISIQDLDVNSLLELHRICIDLYPVQDIFKSEFPHLATFYDANIKAAMKYCTIKDIESTYFNKTTYNETN